jgi:hypothetical protein
MRPSSCSCSCGSFSFSLSFSFSFFNRLSGARKTTKTFALIIDQEKERRMKLDGPSLPLAELRKEAEITIFQWREHFFFFFIDDYSLM